ncbi:hypothetical protein THAOC_06060 [Thalassiosira oceanica]|uniref:MYND-type domain-containing protein n=1 Tax=Thalassiosira oceanica TaxID=159749 RepID=K0TM52_THAOC|nr:hypothetical protein THAOC_06060 [Thalassiosira oceanica]|eukprot:EJK72412.1 hypothetical protein THAOC_06060 [Thalassiosira oceanica]
MENEQTTQNRESLKQASAGRKKSPNRPAGSGQSKRAAASTSKSVPPPEMSCVPVPAPATTPANTEEVCANCGREGSDTVKLKNCTACRLVKYCSLDCQKTHRKQHKKACKKRAAELKDERLFSQGRERPEAHSCPICLLAIPVPMEEYASIRPCCMKMVCNGCGLAERNAGLHNTCPFCRTLVPQTYEEMLAMVQKRVDAKDRRAICQFGAMHGRGLCGLETNVQRGIELWTEAADLESPEALYKMGRFILHRTKLGLLECDNGNHDRALRHFMISAKMGHKDSLDVIKEMFGAGIATKAQYAEGLTGYQDAVQEMKSPERDEAKRIGFAGDRA